MKLRRALVTVATTAAIAPAALISAPAAFADTSASPTPVATSTVSGSATPSATATSAAPTASDSPSASSSLPPTASNPPSTSPTQPFPTGTCDPSDKSAVQTSISGLPGKIATGSGWHKFTLTVGNPTDNTVSGLGVAAEVSTTNENDPFLLRQVDLQAYDENTHQWFDVTGDGQHASGGLDIGDLPAHTAWEYPLRLEVKAGAPVGKGLTIGAAVYPDTNNDCLVVIETRYGIQIVAPGTSTTGSKPVTQTGGEIPISATGKSTTIAASGHMSLADTGAPSQLPMIAGIGGVALLAGAGTVFVARRRKAGPAA